MDEVKKLKQYINDIVAVGSILPDHYTLKEFADAIRCISKTGIKSEAEWELTIVHLKNHFGERFIEIDHNTCTYHVDFVIYFKPDVIRQALLSQKPMKTLEGIKNEVAISYGHTNWTQLAEREGVLTTLQVMDEVAKKYAEQFEPKWIDVKPDSMPADTEENILVSDGINRSIMRGAYLHYIVKEPGTTSLIPKLWMPLPLLPNSKIDKRDLRVPAGPSVT